MAKVNKFEMFEEVNDTEPLRGFEEAPFLPYNATGPARISAPQGSRPGAGLANRVRLSVGPGGRIVIPVALRDAIEIKEGDALLAWVEDGELHLVSPKVSGRKAQLSISQRLAGSGSLVDELVAERRMELEREGSRE